eukprot:scaffold397775_cov24-Prasinocladus_malaysianus.AAC.1
MESMPFGSPVGPAGRTLRPPQRSGAAGARGRAGCRAGGAHPGAQRSSRASSMGSCAPSRAAQTLWVYVPLE